MPYGAQPQVDFRRLALPPGMDRPARASIYDRNQSQGVGVMRIAVLSSRVALGLVAGLTLAGIGAGFAASPEEIVAERRAGYKKMGENFKTMKDAVDAGADVRPLAANAQVVVDWAKQIPTMFPPGTENVGGTHALPTVWSNKADFDKRSGDLLAAATLLQQRAAAGDKDGFVAQFKATGAVCGGCHHDYRAKL